MRTLRIAQLGLAILLLASRSARPDTFTFNVEGEDRGTGTEFEATLTLTATTFNSALGIDKLTGVSGSFWESALGGTSQTNLVSSSEADPFLVVSGGNLVNTANCEASGQSAPESACYANGLFNYDNLIYLSQLPSANSVDWGGILFETSDGLEVNIFSEDNTWYWADSASGHTNNPVTVTLQAQGGSGPVGLNQIDPIATPEPGSLLLLGTGLLVLAFAVRGRSSSRVRASHPR